MFTTARSLTNVFIYHRVFTHLSKSKLNHVLGGIENTISFADIWPSSR